MTELATGKSCNFQKLQIFKTQPLGTGSFGTVYHARGDQLPCAAKILHKVKIKRTGHRDELQLLQTQYEQKYNFLLILHHPNIVHCLGIFADRESGFPTIFMEVMDKNLTHFLDNREEQLPYHLEINIFYDICLAIAYLHSNGIVHRNLSSYNVLLVSGNRAKVADFGWYKVPELSYISMSARAKPYMPPEAFRSPPSFTNRGDSFSLGVLSIQIMTRAYPNPAPATKPMKDPMNPTKRVQGAILEAERRKTHIDLVNPSHPMLQLALRCINYEERDRPGVPELCRELATLRSSPQYNRSLQIAGREKQAIESGYREAEKLQQAAVTHASKSQDLAQVIEAKDRELDATSQQLVAAETAMTASTRDAQRFKRENMKLKEENTQLRSRVEKVSKQLQEREEAMLEKHREVLQLRQQMKEHAVLVDEKEREIDLLKKHRRTATQPEGNNIRLEWSKAHRAPTKMSSGSSAVDDSGLAYFRSSGSSAIHEYNPNTEEWRRLPDCFLEYFALIVIQGELTAVGGKQDGAVTNVLLSLTNVGRVQAWADCFPPMPTKRYYVAAVCTDQQLIVAGGWGESGRVNMVEMLDTKTLQWFVVSSLPHCVSMASATICRDMIYIAGGLDNKGNSVRTFYGCSLSEIIRSSVSPKVAQGKHYGAASPPSPSESGTWQQLQDVPFFESNFTTFCNEVIAVGGRNSEYNPTPAIHVYNSSTDTWDIVSAMLMARYRCLLAVLSGGTIMVVGSHTSFGITDSVEFGYLL